MQLLPEDMHPNHTPTKLQTLQKNVSKIITLDKKNLYFVDNMEK
jgi:hypothetical protein